MVTKIFLGAVIGLFLFVSVPSLLGTFRLLNKGIDDIERKRHRRATFNYR